MADERSDHQQPDLGPGLRGRDLIGLGGLLVGGIVAGLVIGYLVDKAAGTEPTFTLVGIMLGVLVAIAGFVVRVRAALSDGSGGGS